MLNSNTPDCPCGGLPVLNSCNLPNIYVQGFPPAIDQGQQSPFEYWVIHGNTYLAYNRGSSPELWIYKPNDTYDPSTPGFTNTGEWMGGAWQGYLPSKNEIIANIGTCGFSLYTEFVYMDNLCSDTNSLYGLGGPPRIWSNLTLGNVSAYPSQVIDLDSYDSIMDNTSMNAGTPSQPQKEFMYFFRPNCNPDELTQLPFRCSNYVKPLSLLCPIDELILGGERRNSSTGSTFFTNAETSGVAASEFGTPAIKKFNSSLPGGEEQVRIAIDPSKLERGYSYKFTAEWFYDDGNDYVPFIGIDSTAEGELGIIGEVGVFTNNMFTPSQVIQVVFASKGEEHETTSIALRVAIKVKDLCTSESYTYPVTDYIDITL